MRCLTCGIGEGLVTFGRTSEIAGAPFQVIGVMPAGFSAAQSGTELWLPQT